MKGSGKTVAASAAVRKTQKTINSIITLGIAPFLFLRLNPFNDKKQFFKDKQPELLAFVRGFSKPRTPFLKLSQ